MRRLHAEVCARTVDIDVAQLRAALQPYLYRFIATFSGERRRRVANVCCGQLCPINNVNLKIASYISRCFRAGAFHKLAAANASPVSASTTYPRIISAFAATTIAKDKAVKIKRFIILWSLVFYKWLVHSIA